MVSMCPYGLGNKIRSLMSCIMLDPDPRACWAPGDAGTGALPNYLRFSDLFVNPFEISDDQIPADAEIRRHHFLEAPHGDPSPGTTWDLLNGSGFRHPEKRASLRPQVTAACVGAARALEPRPRIREMADGVLSRLPPEFTAVHIRTWSASPGSVGRRRSAAFRKKGGIELYHSKLDEMPERGALFLASDSEDALAKTVERYGAHRVVVSPPARWIGSRSIVEYEWALAEILVMSRASRIIRSWESTFSEVAWWMGGARAEEVTVRDHFGKPMDPRFDLPLLHRRSR